MTALLTLANISALAVVIVKLLAFLSDKFYSSRPTLNGSEEQRSMFADDYSHSSSMFDDDNTNRSMLDDDSPSRGMWDVTSTYYSMMHSDDNSISGSNFDDSWSSTSSISSFDD